VDAGILDEGNKDLAKIGFFTFSSFFKPGQLLKQAKSFGSEARSSIKDVIIQDSELGSDVSNFVSKLRQAGGQTLEKNKPAIEFAESLLADVESGNFKGEILTDAVDNLNSRLTEVGFNSKEGQRLFKIRNILQKSAQKVGETNPEFINNFNEGQSIWSALHTKNTVSQFMKRFVPKAVLKTLPKELQSFLGATGEAAFLPVDLPADFLRRFGNPSVLRFYSNLITNVAANKLPAAANNLKNLNKEFKKTEDKEESQ
jgi:hypothetical protein